MNGESVKRCISNCEEQFKGQNYYIVESGQNHCIGTRCPNNKPRDIFYYVPNSQSTKCIDKCPNTHKYADNSTGECKATCEYFVDITGNSTEEAINPKQKLFCVDSCTKYYEEITDGSYTLKKCIDTCPDGKPMAHVDGSNLRCEDSCAEQKNGYYMYVLN